MSAKKIFSLAVPAILAGIGVLWLKRRTQEVQGLASWQRVLAEQYGSVKAQRLAEQVRQRYRFLLAECPLPENTRLRRHVTEHILPGLALYQVLLSENGGDRQSALTEIDAAWRRSTLAANRPMAAALKIVPAPFGMLRLAFKGVMKAYPAEGWDFEYVENSTERVAFNATRCFYLNTLTAYGAPELTASFCKTDDVMAELFPPSVRFVRPHTLGRGDEVCNFQYCRGR